MVIVWASGFLQISLWPSLAPRSPSSVCHGWTCRELWHLYTAVLGVASSFQEVQPIPDSSYLIQSGEVLTSSFLLLSVFLEILSSSFDLTASTMNFWSKLLSTKYTSFYCCWFFNKEWSVLVILNTCRNSLKCDKLGVGDSHSKRRDWLGQSIVQLTGLHLFWPWKFLTEEREPLWNTRCSVWRM